MNLETSTITARQATLRSLFERRDTRAHLIVCGIVIATVAAILAPLMMRGWIPHDEGTLAQSAHRVLLGQLPHRDFDEIYTGGLAFLHAGAFRALGERLTSLRVVLLGFILVSIPAFYYIASRFAPAVTAGIVTIAIVGWSFMNYAASMPSWFNLLFAIGGCAALMRWRETDRLRWLLLAGVCGGLSVTIKVVGFYFVAAALLYLAFEAASSSEDAAEGRSTADMLARIALCVGITVASTLPFAMMRSAASLGQFVNLAAPATATALFVSFQVMRAANARALTRLLKNAAVLFVGVVLPVLLFMIPYLKSGSTGALYEGLFVLPQKRLIGAANGGPPNWGVFLPPTWLALILLPWFADHRIGKTGTIVSAVVCGAIVLIARQSFVAYEWVFLSVAMAALPMVLVGVGLVGRALVKRETGVAPIKREYVFLLLATTAWCGLIQFPFTGPIYFCYVAPLVILSALAIASTFAPGSVRVGSGILATYLVLGLLMHDKFFSIVFERASLADQRTALLDVPRGGLTIRADERQLYHALIDTIQARSHSRFIYVTPDAPEVYFLANKENPTRTLFDFFDDPVGRDERILRSISDHQVQVVVLNLAADFSGQVPRALHDSLAHRFPVGVRMGRFVVRWEAPNPVLSLGQPVSGSRATIADSRRP